MLILRAAKDRGISEHGWLSARHTFSFAHYYDPEQMGFSDLLVINDDRVAPGTGFGTHPHRDMEIFTYVLEGALEHKDSMGTGTVIRPGDVQMMSAGTGITHSEFNHHKQGARVHLLQIWILPSRSGVEPRYSQHFFPESEKRGKLRLIISPDEAEGSLPVWQDVRVYAGLINGEETASLILPPQRYAYVHVARGSVVLNDLPLKEGDGVRVMDEPSLYLHDGKEAEVLIFDLRPHLRPEGR